MTFYENMSISFVAFIFLLPVLNAGEEGITLYPVKSFCLEGNIAKIGRSNARL
jgi:hypothetical protein